MAQTADINKSRYEELRKNPVFFLKFFENIRYDDNGNEIDCSTWRSLDRDLNISFDAGTFADRELGYALCVLEEGKEKVDEKGNRYPDTITIKFHCAAPNSVNDWIYIINCFVIRSQNRDDKYAFMELLWALDKLYWTKETLISAWSQYPAATVPFFVQEFQKFGRVLSYNKQMALKSVLTSYSGRYDIYLPEVIKQAYRCIPNESNQIPPQRKAKIEQLNLFSIIDAIFDEGNLQAINGDNNESNSIILFHSWLHGQHSLENYNSILNIFPLLSEKIRLQIVKRYFHDIRNKHTSFDVNFIKDIKDNKFEDFIRYRYCVESPAEPVVLTVPLLCDTLITLHNSNGNSFQTFDGILDFAMTRCDTAHPAIDFGLQRFIPTCNRGAVYNIDKFKGFIDYAIIRKMNKDLITEEHLRAVLSYLMDKHARRQTYPVCRYGDGTKIPDETFQYCGKRREYKTTVNGQERLQSYALECFKYCQYNDRWYISHENLKYIQDFLHDKNIPYSQTYSISLDMFSTNKLKTYILSLPDKFTVLQNGEFLVHSYNRRDVDNNFNLYLIQEFSDSLRMRIFPQQGALVGLQFDVFGFWQEIRQSLPIEILRNQQSNEYKEARAKYEEKEAEEVRNRCIASLRRELKTELINEAFFEIPYNRTLLSDTIKRFYFKGTIGEKDELHQRQFLTKSNLTSNFVQYCAPQLSEATNPAIDLPYFWCRGKECFQNNLGTQTLEEESNWQNYTFFHLSEIMGFPQLHMTVAGYEPEPSVWQFIAITNKVMQKFRRLKCRACGHMMFTERTSGFNRYSYYECVNPTCAEVRHPVYLNFCFKCKKGLIDSRDTKQCPNGWYICPTCLACCDDEQYERQAQRYILTKRPVPPRIQEKRGKGHNDKGVYFCPQCGNPIQEIDDGHGNTFRGCPECNINFDARPDGFYG